MEMDGKMGAHLGGSKDVGSFPDGGDRGVEWTTSADRAWVRIGVAEVEPTLCEGRLNGAAGLGLVLTVIESASGGQLLDILEHVGDAGGGIRQLQFALAWRVEDEAAAGRRIQFAPGRGVPTLGVILADTLGGDGLSQVIKANPGRLSREERTALRFLARCRELLEAGPKEMLSAFFALTEEGQMLSSVHPFAGLPDAKVREEIHERTRRQT